VVDRREWVAWLGLGLALAVALITGLPWPTGDGVRTFCILLLTPLLAMLGHCLSHLPVSFTAPARGLRWLAYGLPSLTCWTLSFVAFFPAILGSDGTDEWDQALGTRPLNDWHTLGHVLTLRLLAKLWKTPATLALLQILVLSSLVAWGCRLLRLLGVPRAPVMTVAFAIAVAPVNLIGVVTIVKDVPYACAVLALTLLLVQRYLRAAQKPPLSSWIALWAAGMAAMAYRHNGLTAVLGTMAGLIWLGDEFRRPLLWGAITLATGTGLHMALLRVTGAAPQPASYGLVGLLAAHVQARTPLAPSERAELDLLMPTSGGWPYDCLTSDTTTFDSRFDFRRLRSENLELFRLASALSLRAPLVTLRHLACSSSALRLIASKRGVGATELTFDSSNEMRAVAPWPPGPPSRPVWPGLRQFLGQIIQRTGYPDCDWFFWRPALALYLLLFCVAVACFRQSWRLLAIAGPILFHTLGLVAVMPGQVARYQYPTVLAFELLALPLLRVPRRPSSAPGPSARTPFEERS